MEFLKIYYDDHDVYIQYFTRIEKSNKICHKVFKIQ